MEPGDESGADRLVSELSARFTRLPLERHFRHGTP